MGKARKWKNKEYSYHRSAKDYVRDKKTKRFIDGISS
jgi:hypothetical protein